MAKLPRKPYLTEEVMAGLKVLYKSVDLDSVSVTNGDMDLVLGAAKWIRDSDRFIRNRNKTRREAARAAAAERARRRQLIRDNRREA